MKLLGRKAIITGASQGFGLAVAKEFIEQGASLVVCGRHLHDLEAAYAEFKKDTNKITCVKADIANREDTEHLIDVAIREMGGLDILVANAGVHGPKGTLDEIDWDEWSAAIDVNLKGTALTCKAVLPHFKEQHYGKIIILSGGGATKPMIGLSAYAASKAGVVRFAENLACEVNEFNIDVNSLAPGALNTRLLEDVLMAGPEKVGEAYYKKLLEQQKSGGAPLEVGAKLCTYLASAESDGITGKLISAIWDPWSHFDQLKNQLKESDIYTLRRIVPEDRQQDWSALCSE